MSTTYFYYAYYASLGDSDVVCARCSGYVLNNRERAWQLRRFRQRVAQQQKVHVSEVCVRFEADASKNRVVD